MQSTKIKEMQSMIKKEHITSKMHRRPNAQIKGVINPPQEKSLVLQRPAKFIFIGFDRVQC
jgi:hypothetical protein